MTTTTRTTALGVFTALMLAIGSPQDAVAHADTRYAETPTNLRAEGVAGSSHNTVAVSWDEEDHRHDIGPAFLITLYTKPLPSRVDGGTGNDVRTCLRHYRERPPAGCFRRTMQRRNALTGHGYSIRVTDLQPETRYYVHVLATFFSVTSRSGDSDGATATFTTTASPGTPDPEPPTTPDPETPTTPDPETPEPPTTPDPETPTPPDPETPEPEAPDCTYEHRLAGIPGSTANAYTARILVSSKEPNATATIRAYQHDNGHPIDVLDEGGSAVGATTSLAPAHSIKRFRLEDARGWHSIIVEHPTARAMRRATVTMMLRGPDVGVQIVPVQGIEDCTPASTTTE